MTFLISLFEKGGPVMWPLLVCSLVSATVSIDRLIFWWRVARAGRIPDEGAVFDMIVRGDFDGVVKSLTSSRSVAARVLLSGIRERDHGFAETMAIQAGNEVDAMKRGLSILDTIVTMAPLLGILGTVIGIIESFDLLSSSGIEDPKAVIGGISQALITTATGLAVALATLLPLNYFIALTQRTTRAVEQSCTRFEMAFRRAVGQ